MKLLRILTLSTLAVIFLGAGYTSALDFSVNINDGSINQNTNYILKSGIVGGNHSETHNLNFTNSSSENMSVSLEKSVITKNSKLLNATDLKIYDENDNEISSDQYYNLKDKHLLCIGPGKKNDLKLKMHVDENIDNSYQGLSFEIKSRFIVQSGCGLDPGNPGEEIPGIDAPNTGIFSKESLWIWLFLGFIFFGTLILLKFNSDEKNQTE